MLATLKIANFVTLIKYQGLMLIIVLNERRVIWQRSLIPKSFQPEEPLQNINVSFRIKMFTYLSSLTDFNLEFWKFRCVITEYIFFFVNVSCYTYSLLSINQYRYM